MYKEYLQKAKDASIPVAVYTNKEDTREVRCGLVQGLSDDFLLLAQITSHGFYEGYLTQRLPDIYRLENGERYDQRLYRLYTLRGQTHPPVEEKTGDPVADLLSFGKDKRLVVSIELFHSEEDDVIGFVEEIRENCVTIAQLDRDGKSNGNSLISMGDITRIDCDTDDESAIKFLAEQGEA